MQPTLRVLTLQAFIGATTGIDVVVLLYLDVYCSSGDTCKTIQTASILFTLALTATLALVAMSVALVWVVRNERSSSPRGGKTQPWWLRFFYEQGKPLLWFTFLFPGGLLLLASLMSGGTPCDPAPSSACELGATGAFDVVVGFDGTLLGTCLILLVLAFVLHSKEDRADSPPSGGGWAYFTKE